LTFDRETEGRVHCCSSMRRQPPSVSNDSF